MGCASFVGPLDRILPSMYEPQKSGGILQSWQLAWWVDSKLKIFVFFVAVWLQSPTLRSVQQNTYNKSSAMAPMKAMAKSVKVMTKGALATELADAAGLKKGDTTKATGQYRSCVTCCFFLQMLRKYGSNTKKSVTSHLGEGCEGFLACEVWNQVLDLLAEIGTKEVKKTGKFTLPGLCMIKTRKKKVSWWNLHQFFPHSYWKFNMLPAWFSRKSATEATKGTGFRVLASFKSKNLKQMHFHFSLYPSMKLHRWQEDDVWKGHILSFLISFILNVFYILQNMENFSHKQICRFLQVTCCKEVKVKPQPAKTVVKAFCVSALKKSI